MLKSMIFIDYENFEINYSIYYKNQGVTIPWLDYNKFPRNLVKNISPNYDLVKTLMFIPKPDDFLMQDAYYKNRYEWFDSIRSINNLTIIEGEHIARPAPTFKREQMDVTNRSTYYVSEKGTDVNLTAHLLTKGFMNAYDVAIIVRYIVLAFRYRSRRPVRPKGRTEHYALILVIKNVFSPLLNYGTDRRGSVPPYSICSL